MKAFLRTLLISNLKEESLEHKENVLCNQWNNAKKIWYNTDKGNSNSIGVERILKLILIVSQFVFPGIYVRAFFGSKGKLHKHLGVELQVLSKLVIAITILTFGFYNLTNTFFGIKLINIWSMWMILETLFYTGNLVFSEEVFSKPHSNKRNLILIIIDYITLNYDFAILYLANKAIQQTVDGNFEIITTAYDAIYFSFISSLTIGYGDIIPTHEGRGIVVFHSFSMLIFGILFLNFYLSRVNNK